MDYGDSRVCKTLAGEFESLASHKNMLLSSNGRTPASQADVNAGSIPVKSTKIGLTSGVGTGVLR